MVRTVVGVLRGGTSSEYNLSLKTGASMMAALPEDAYEVRDILIDRSGMWHLRGSPATPARALAQVDVVLSALHGGVGEDGTVQRILDRAGVAYAGSRPLPSGLSLNKIRAREMLRSAEVHMPRAAAFSARNDMSTADMARAVFSQFGPPYVVKPPAEGAGEGILIARMLGELPDALGDTIDRYGAALVEEYVRGREVSVGLLERFRGDDLYAFPPAHVKHDYPYLAPRHHAEAAVVHVCPSPFTHDEKRVLAEAARAAHRALGLSHFSRADLMLAPGGVYLLEINAIPGLYPGSSLPAMLEAVGSSVREFLEHAIALARGR